MGALTLIANATRQSELMHPTRMAHRYTRFASTLSARPAPLPKLAFVGVQHKASLPQQREPFMDTARILLGALRRSAKARRSQTKPGHRPTR
jgi:hypothetical protein